MLQIRQAEDIAPAFEELKDRPDALYVCIDTILFANRICINTLALAAHLPMMLTATFRENLVLTEAQVIELERATDFVECLSLNVTVMG